MLDLSGLQPQVRYIGVNLGDSVNFPPPNARVSFVSEIKSMLYGFGESRTPKVETAIAIEEICQLQMLEIVTRCCEVAKSRGALLVSVEDVLFLIRRNPIKVQRLVRYLTVIDITQPLKGNDQLKMATSKRIDRCQKFIEMIDGDCESPLMKAVKGQLEDYELLERNRRLDQLSKDLDVRRYTEFTRARQVSFLNHKFKLNQKFQEWTIQDCPKADLLPIDQTCFESLAFLAFETVGNLVEVALKIRHEETTPDVLIRSMDPQMYNSGYFARLSDHLPSQRSAAHILDEKFQPTWMSPLDPKHIHEAFRRLSSTTPKKRGGAQSFALIAI